MKAAQRPKAAPESSHSPRAGHAEETASPSSPPPPAPVSSSRPWHNQPIWVPRPRGLFPRDPPPGAPLKDFLLSGTSQMLCKKRTKQRAEVCGFIPKNPSAVHRDRIPLAFRVPLWLLPSSPRHQIKPLPASRRHQQHRTFLIRKISPAQTCR